MSLKLSRYLLRDIPRLGSLIITEQPGPGHSLRQESEGRTSVFPLQHHWNILGSYWGCIYLLNFFFFFFFLSRRMSAREEPSILLLSRGGKDERAIVTRAYFALNGPLIREVDVSTSN